MTPAASAATPASSYQKWLLTKPVPPPVPSVKRQEWVRNPIDAFVMARLEEKGMTPAPPASRRALIRRAYFSLIGLPPTPRQVEDFEKDSSPNAFEKVIDQLLASEHYGERWGRHWLDLARFAESDGFAIDGERPVAWRYRDYVIRSFNQDEPYDQFIREQIAGDENQGRKGAKGIPSEPAEGALALGFLRMGPWEADANFDTQLRLDFLNEITTTTAQVFLGLTVGCARCHDHKYDPISQRDFYRMQAFFAATRMDNVAAPFIKAEDPAAMRRLSRQYEDERDSLAEQFRDLERVLRAKYAAAKKLAADDKDAEDFRKALGDKKDTIFTEAEKKQYTDLRDRTRQYAELLARYQPVAYSVSDVVPPYVMEVNPTYVLGGGDLSAKGDKVEPGYLKCIVGKEEPATIPFAGRFHSGTPQRVGRLDRQLRKPSHRARHGQPHLAASFR
jgi:hypothetical protein